MTACHWQADKQTTRVNKQLRSQYDIILFPCCVLRCKAQINFVSVPFGKCSNRWVGIWSLASCQMHKQALEIAGLESLQSLISRGCRLIAVAVPYSDFFNSSHLASLRWSASCWPCVSTTDWCLLIEHEWHEEWNNIFDLKSKNKIKTY